VNGAPEAKIPPTGATSEAISTGTRFVAHVGASMNPTFSEEDLLEVSPYGDTQIRAGDVILCRPPGAERLVVHRVVTATPNGVRTRGDNNALVDPWLLQPGDVVGRVVAARTGKRRRTIPGGRSGALLAGWIRRRRPFAAALARLLHPAYHELADLGLVQALVPAAWRPRVAVFEAGSERRLRLLVGRRVVGYYDPRQGRWHIRRPFRLLITPHSLPSAPTLETPER
jgi:signal peptidase I